jgi:hypothetical protein
MYGHEAMSAETLQATSLLDFSATQREIAVTSLRGAKRTDCARSQLCAPEIATVRPAIRPRYPSRATFSADVMIAGKEFGKFVSDAAGGADDEDAHPIILAGNDRWDRSEKHMR